MFTQILKSVFHPAVATPPDPTTALGLIATAPPARTPAPASQAAPTATLTQEPAVQVHLGPPAPPTPGYDATSWNADVDRAVREGTTVAKIARERAVRESPPATVRAAMDDTAKIEAQLADARAREASAIALHEQHEVLLQALERAQRDVRVLKETLASLQAALNDKSSIEERCALHLRDDVYAISKLNQTYGLLSVLGFQAADLREGIPVFEQRVVAARAALVAFEKANGIKANW